jgi:hypothetical protein
MLQTKDLIKSTPWSVKKTYEIFRRRSCPTYVSGKKFDDIWIKLSNILNEKQICHIVFIESLFEDWGCIPYPNQLCSEKAFQICYKYIHKNITIGQLEFENQIRTINNSIELYAKEKEEKLDYVLSLEFLPIKSYTRLLMCSDSMYEKFKTKYFNTAVAEIKSNPSVDKYLKDNYVSRYIRLFPQRFPAVNSSSCDTLPEPSRSFKGGENIPVRRRPSGT